MCEETRRMYFLAARNLSNDSILIRAQSSSTRHTQNSLCSARWYGTGAADILRSRSFIAVTSSGFSETLPPDDEFRGWLWRGGEREKAIYYARTLMVKAKFPAFPHPVNFEPTGFPEVARPTYGKLCVLQTMAH